MLKPAPMELFSVVVLDEDLEKVSELIVRQGVLHLVKINELESWAEKLEAAGTSELLNKYLEADKKIKDILVKLGETPSVGKETMAYRMPVLSIEEITARLNEIENSLKPVFIKKEY